MVVGFGGEVFFVDEAFDNWLVEAAVITPRRRESGRSVGRSVWTCVAAIWTSSVHFKFLARRDEHLASSAIEAQQISTLYPCRHNTPHHFFRRAISHSTLPAAFASPNAVTTAM